LISEATFVRSAASAEDLPSDGLAEIALVGRSNVGKSSLINALVRQRIARTSAAPGKTRLANLYRVTRGRGRPLYLVDLPGYGYARGGRESAEAFEKLTHEFFAVRGVHLQPDPAALLLVDARHPGLSADVDAWRWLRQAVDRSAIVATKIDKLARGERIRALREFESVFDDPVLPVSAVTGEGMDDLWKLIERLRPSSSNPARDSRPNSRNSPEETGRPRPPLPRPKNSSSRR
jgi:GTP-binding protein